MSPPTIITKVADTVVLNPYNICQNVSLLIGSNYQFQYNVITDLSSVKCTVEITINLISKYSNTYNKSAALYN